MLPRMPNHLSRSSLGIGVADFSNLPAARDNLEAAGSGFEKHGSILRSNVGDQVSEPVHLQTQPRATGFRPPAFGFGAVKRTYSSTSSPNFCESTSFARYAATGAKISRAWNVLLTGCRIVMIRGDMTHVHAALSGIHQRKHSVVGRDEMVLIAGGNYRPARRTHARIDYYHVYRSSGKVRIGLRNRERAIEHVKSLYRMANIDDLRLWHDVQDHAFHGAHKMIVAAKIGGQSNDRTLRQNSLAVRRRVIPEPRN